MMSCRETELQGEEDCSVAANPQRACVEERQLFSHRSLTSTVCGWTQGESAGRFCVWGLHGVGSAGYGGIGRFSGGESGQGRQPAIQRLGFELAVGSFCARVLGRFCTVGFGSADHRIPACPSLSFELGFKQLAACRSRV
jgi:hypothetical protein